jgi:nanoRNase/pAp phosphatase (c-di-AMP/oligoRNAs hydrolase)
MAYRFPTSTLITESAHHARRLLEFLEAQRDKISPLLILTHDYPDPDALAAAFALAYLAQQQYQIDCQIAYGGIIGRTENRAMVSILKIPARPLRPSHLKKYRHVALVDTQPGFQNNSFRSNRKATIVIDQHPSHRDPLADLTLVDTQCGATCVIVAEALLMRSVEIPPRLATAIAYGILSDTLDLYRVQRADVVETYLAVLQYADMKMLARIQNPPRARPFFSTLGRGIREAVTCRRVIVSHLGPIANPDLVAQTAEFLLTYEQAHWSFCTGRYKEKLHLSLRTIKQNVQAGEILRDIVPHRSQAGGHAQIAGGSFKIGTHAAEEDWAKAEALIQEGLFKRLRISSKATRRKPFQRP